MEDFPFLCFHTKEKNWKDNWHYLITLKKKENLDLIDNFYIASVEA